MNILNVVFKTDTKKVVFKTSSTEIITFSGETNILFIGNSGLIILDMPYWGYSTVIKMNLHYSKTLSGYKIGDDGAQYDSRICRIPLWLFPESKQLVFSQFLNNINNGRGENFVLSLPQNSGFFPFGADKGDSGRFTVSVIDYQKKGALQQPYLQHENSIDLMLVEAPSYTPVGVESEGALQIGTVSTLRPFQTFPKPNDFINIIRNVSRGGIISSIDIGNSTDIYESEILLDMRQGNCSALITYLTGIRGDSFNVIPPANSWIFGIDNDDTATYSCKNLSNELIVTHDNFNHWTMNLKLWLI